MKKNHSFICTFSPIYMYIQSKREEKMSSQEKSVVEKTLTMIRNLDTIMAAIEELSRRLVYITEAYEEQRVRQSERGVGDCRDQVYYRWLCCSARSIDLQILTQGDKYWVDAWIGELQSSSN